MKTTFNLSEAEKRKKEKKARLIVLFLIVFLSGAAVGEAYGQGVAIVESEPITPDPSSILDLQSTERGFLVPRMTTAERLEISKKSPAQGLLVFDTNTKSFWFFDSVWKEIVSALSSPTFNSLTIEGALWANSATISGSITAATVNGRNVALDGMNLDSLQKLTGVVAGSTNFGTGTFTGSIISDNATIKSALQELETVLEAQTYNQTAAEVPFTPAGNISSTDVQSAIEELDAGKFSLSGDILGISNGGTGAATSTEAFNALSPITNTGDIIYGSAANVSSRLQGNTSTTTMVLSQTGDGTNSAAPEWRYPYLSYVENYLSENVPSTVPLSVDIYSDALASISLDEGTWMITSETTIVYTGTDETWNATVVLGTAPTSVYTSGQSSTTAFGPSETAITISLSKIVTLSSNTTVSLFAKANVPATVVNTIPSEPSTAETATAIHAIRIK